MKFRDRSRTMRPDLSVAVPLIVLFATSLSGSSIHEAFHRSMDLFFSLPSGLILWTEVVVLNALLYIYFAPVFKIHIRCLKSCEPGQEKVDKALGHLNRLYAFILGVSVLSFTLGRFCLILSELGGFDELGGLAGKWGLRIAEAAADGFFVGVILSLQFEDRLFKARETILGLHPRGRIGYASLYSKVFLAILAIVFFMLFQAFSAAGSFFSLGAPHDVPGLEGPGLPLTGPDFLFQVRHFAGLRETLDVFLLRLIILGIPVGKMVYQIKRLIGRPIATVLGSLRILNSPDPASGATISIVQNDEFAAVYREINTLIMRQRSEIESSRRRLEAIVAGAADPILALDGKGRIRLFNPAAEAALGYRRETVFGKGLDLFFGEEAGSFLAAHRPQGGDPTGGENQGEGLRDGGLVRKEWRRAEGSSLLMESHLSILGGGEEAWMTLILRDIRRQVELEESLRRATSEAETASRMKSEFLANMSHELRTPLNAILGFTQLLAGDRNLTGVQQDRVRVISRSGEHLLALINDILDISKIEAGKMELHESVFDLPELLGDLRDMFELRCRKKGLSLYTDTVEDLPRYVRGDIGKLRQVLVNLIGNAVKFTAEGGIGILVGKEGELIRFSVRDTGRGIPVEEQTSILLPFVQASTTDHEGGTGLGLAISSRYVVMLGGTLEVKSRVGEGSVFSFSIPLPESEEAPLLEEEGELDIQIEPGTETTVLVVDDQEANRLVLKEMLEPVGFSVLEAKDGREALEIAARTLPAIVFMDIKMPVMDGYEAVAELKKRADTREMRVFALTASAFSQDEERIRTAGFDGFLAKPFKVSSLYRLIRDKGGLALRTSRRPTEPVQGADSLGPEDFRSARRALGTAGLEQLEEAALINDFASLGELAAGLGATAPAFSQALGASAGSYDEAAIAALIAGVKEGKE